MAKSKAKPKSKSQLKPKTKPAAKAGKAKTKVAPKQPVKAAKKRAAKPVAKVTAKPAAKTVAAKPAAKSAAPKMTAGTGMKRFNPLDDRIVIERVVGEQRTAGGLYIPDSAQEKPTTGRVVAVGRGHRDAKGRIRPCDVKVGDTVLFSAWAGTEIEVEGAKYVVMREPDLLGVTTR